MFRDNNVVEENIPFVFENFTVDIYEKDILDDFFNMSSKSNKNSFNY